MSAPPVATNPPERLAHPRAWSPVVTGVVAVLALFGSLAILVGAALGRMEARLRADVAAVAVDVRGDLADLAADVRQLRADVQLSVTASPASRAR